LNVSGLYELPLGPGKRFLNRGGMLAKNLLNGWQFGGVFQYSSGTPLRIGANGSPLRTGNIANLVAGQSLTVDYNNYYKGLPVFNTGAFSSPGRFAVGDAPRRIEGLRTSFNANENINLAKHFYFSERVGAELRMEFFNILNRMQICDPETNVDNATLGESTAAPSARRTALEQDKPSSKLVSEPCWSEPLQYRKSRKPGLVEPRHFFLVFSPLINIELRVNFEPLLQPFNFN